MKTKFTLACLLLCSKFAFAQWVQTKGPYAAHTSAMITVGNNIYAANRDFTITDGRVYRSSDLGQEWVAADNGIDVEYVTQFANIGETILAASASADVFGVFRTVNQGNNWTLSSGLFAPSLSVEAIGNVFWCGTDGGGIFRSLDLGLSFQPMNTGVLANAGTVIVYDIAYINGNILLATEGGGGPARLYRSGDNGASWELANSGLPLGTNPQHFAVNGNTIFVSSTGDFADYDYGLYKSDDNGTTWTECNNGIPEILYGNTGEVWANEGVVYVTTTYNDESPKIYKSIDNGNSFTPAASGLYSNHQQAEAFTAAGGYIFAGLNGYGSVFRSANQGASWEEARRGLANATVFSMMEQNGRVYAGAQQGLFYTVDGGSNWTEMRNGLPFGLPITTMTKNGAAIFLGTDQYGVFRSLDNGSSWMQVNTGLNATYAQNISDLLYANNALYAATADGIYKTTNNGAVWTLAGNGLPTEFGGSLVSVNCLTEQSGALYAGTVLEGIYKSVNGGVSWVAVNSGLQPFAARTVHSIVPAGTNLFAATDNGVFMSTNNGSSWTATSLNGGNMKRLYVANGIIYASQYAPTVLAGLSMYKSVDNGVSWTPFNDGMFPNERIRAFLHSGGYLYAATDTRSVWRRLAAGVVPITLRNFTGRKAATGNLLSWITDAEQDNRGFEIQRSSDGVSFAKVHFQSSKGVSGNSTTPLFYDWIDPTPPASRNWYRLKQEDAAGRQVYSDVVLIRSDANAGLDLGLLFPNPAKGVLQIRIAGARGGDIILMITDATGKRMQERRFSLNRGEQTLKFDVSILPAGIYYLKAVGADGIETAGKQFIKE